jgi:hypothetical protein
VEATPARAAPFLPVLGCAGFELVVFEFPPVVVVVLFAAVPPGPVVTGDCPLGDEIAKATEAPLVQIQQQKELNIPDWAGGCVELLFVSTYASERPRPKHCETGMMFSFGLVRARASGRM